MRIHQLEQRLANQIAAGEVVERPASIVKELLENCIDAGATQIKIDIEKGGMSRIVINDNGRGIVKEDLPLALARHATSKIATSDDLANIQSLGFRGEALASICSVSHLVLQSCASDADTAWQVVAEGKTLAPKVAPVSHPVGTTVDVRDLFFNLPARRKFLRSAKTEFIRIEDIVKKIALSQESLNIQLKHNGRMVLNIPGKNECGSQEKRIQAVCGQRFIDNAIHIEFEATDLSLHGFISLPDYSRSQTDLQYVFLNGRVIRDKVVSHAIRQAYADVITPGRHPCFVLYLTVNPASVDVNVHPTKHEVRFRESQLVHDFILYRLASVLHDKPLPEIPVIQQRTVRQVAEPSVAYHAPVSQPTFHIEHTIENRFVLYTQQHQLYCVDLSNAIKQQLDFLLTTMSSEFTVTKDLLFPERLLCSTGTDLSMVIEMLAKLKIGVVQDGEHIIVNTLPMILHMVEISAIRELLLKVLTQVEDLDCELILAQLKALVPAHIKPLTDEDKVALISEVAMQSTDDINSIHCHLTAERLDALLSSA